MSYRTEVTRSLADLGDAQSALDDAKGGPVAVVEDGRVVAYLVPAEAVDAQVEPGHRVATLEEVERVLEERRAVSQPILDWLRDK